ncbi:MAG: flagellin [Pseudothermotoga sp.]|uniref:flagellin n=1 Tax=Pseudothermotoga sp. TaxID=2033661 RepID=UPI0019A28A8C|nr:flagellin [Pseudothermotoga sp.]
MRINEISGIWAIRQLQLLSGQQSGLIDQLSRATIPFNQDVSSSAIAERLKTQISGYQRAMYESHNATGMLSTAEAGLGSIHSVLNRLRQLAVQASSPTLSDSDRSVLQEEYSQLLQQINSVSQNVSYNNIRVLAGEVTNFTVQTGPNEGQRMSITIPAVDSERLGLSSTNIASIENAQLALEAIDQATESVSRTRSYVGATTNRLLSAINEMSGTMINLTSSVSRLADTDFARSTMELFKTQLLQQSSLINMIHSNVSRQSVLRLFY